jgi:hypothetical protein
MSNVPESIVVSEDGYSLPVIEVLTGRGFITGKSGSGKSNTASVIAEELLASGVSILIVDTDGEYYGLKEQFDLLHAGADGNCDVEVGAEDAEEIAETAVVEDVPVILDVSGYMDGATVDEIIKSVVEALFRIEKEERKPFLLFVEEVHEFIPETGGLDDLGEMLIRVAKRGRKRGLGMVGMSQRPAAVDKDFITQCDWLVWHRLTWDNDTKVAGQIMGSDYSDAVQDLDTGEAFVMTDWDEVITRIQFRRKRTLDAGATPDLSALENTDQGRDDVPEEPPDGAAPGEEPPTAEDGQPDAPPGDASPSDAPPGDAPPGDAPSGDEAAAGEQANAAATDAQSGQQPATSPDQQPAAGQQPPAGSGQQPVPGQAQQPASQRPNQQQPATEPRPTQAPATTETSPAPDRGGSGGGDESVVVENSLAERARRGGPNDQRGTGAAEGRDGKSRKRKPAESHPSDDTPVRVLWEFGHMMVHAAWAAAARVKRAAVAVASAFAAGCRAVASAFVGGCRAIAGSGARARRAVGREWTDAPEDADSPAESVTAETGVDVHTSTDVDADADDDGERYVTLLILLALALLAVVLVVAAL